MASWRMAGSLVTLLREVNERWPGRDKTSDGGVGDLAHSNRTSDHNPDTLGIVRARDFDKDGPGGLNVASGLMAALLASRDPRIKYLIWEGRMWRSYDRPGIPAWTPTKYTGPNGHFQHCHVSVVADARGDDPAPWGVWPARPTRPTMTTAPQETDDMAHVPQSQWNDVLAAIGRIDQRVSNMQDAVARLDPEVLEAQKATARAVHELAEQVRQLTTTPTTPEVPQ